MYMWKTDCKVIACRARSSVWLEPRAYNSEVVGSNPIGRIKAFRLV